MPTFEELLSHAQKKRQAEPARASEAANTFLIIMHEVRERGAFYRLNPAMRVGIRCA